LTAYQLLISHLRPYRRGILLGVGFMLLEMFTTLATPWLAGRFTQTLIGSADGIGFNTTQLLGLWALVLLLQFGSRATNGYLFSVTAAKVMVDLSRRVHDHLQILPLSFHQERKSGELLALLSHDVTLLSYFVSGPLASVVPLLVLFVGAAVMILLIDTVFGVALLLLVPLLVLLTKWLGRKARPLAGEAVREQAESLAVANETLGMLRIIKAHTLEQVRHAAYRDQTDTVLGVRKRQLWIQATVTPAVYLVASLVLLGLLWWAGERLKTGQLSTPDLVSIGLYGLLLIRPVSGLGGIYLQLEQARGASHRLIEVLQQQPEPIHAGGRPLGPLAASVEFRDIGFSYPGRPPLLDRINLTIRKGEIVALTGINGAGKTTLAHLLMRFIDPDTGAVLVDGNDIADVDLLSLRRQIGYVPQEVLIANTTVRDNIAFGRPEATEQAIVEAAIAAKADGFIYELPQGYDTRVGDQGAKLSGGQRQRLALARALLANPSILILDEATSQIDREGEAEFIDAAHGALAGHTVILVSHRPAMLALAKRIYRLEDGGLTEEVQTPSHG
jgi:ABC-type multidrug transport system fused ATPase/permease subunit